MQTENQALQTQLTQLKTQLTGLPDYSAMQRSIDMKSRDCSRGRVMRIRLFFSGKRSFWSQRFIVKKVMFVPNLAGSARTVKGQPKTMVAKGKKIVSLL